MDLIEAEFDDGVCRPTRRLAPRKGGYAEGEELAEEGLCDRASDRQYAK